MKVSDIAPHMGTEQAKAEFDERRDMAAKDEKEILGEFVRNERTIMNERTAYNYGLFNLMMQTHSFKDFVNEPPIEGMRHLYKCLIPHIQRMCEERNALLSYISILEQGRVPTAAEDIKLTEIKSKLDVMTMAETLLNKVTAAARARAKAGVYLPKKEIITS